MGQGALEDFYGMGSSNLIRNFFTAPHGHQVGRDKPVQEPKPGPSP